MPNGRSSGCSSACCILCTLSCILLSFAISVGIFVLTIWLVFRPSKLQVQVEDAHLVRFNLSSIPKETYGALSYSLSLDLSIRNPNKRLAIYYDSIDAVAVYDGYRFGYNGSFPAFFQDLENTTTIHPKFEGQQALAMSSTADTYSREKVDGWFHSEVKIYTRVRFKAWFIKTNKYTPKFTCNLKLPVPSARGNVSFSMTRCDVHIF